MIFSLGAERKHASGPDSFAPWLTHCGTANGSFENGDMQAGGGPGKTVDKSCRTHQLSAARTQDLQSFLMNRWKGAENLPARRAAASP